MDREAWQTAVHGVTESQTRLSNQHFHFFLHSFETPDSYNSTGINRFSLMPLAEIPGLEFSGGGKRGEWQLHLGSLAWLVGGPRSPGAEDG